ncbi:MAG TPA: P1 family peptidase [Vicinamibacterales bacterium]|nr:P1 family peptidase [Vicinamibacterales bacterium]
MSSVAFLVLAAATLTAQNDARPRAREIGLAPGVFAPGPRNAITDVAGVTVGHATLNQGDSVRTGVTVIVPHGGNVFQEKVPGAVFVGNAFGKLAGSTQVDELGTIETPIALTNTLSVGAAIEGLVSWTLNQPGNTDVRSVNALVGETNDSGLNDIRGQHVRPQHVLEALKAVSSGDVQEGSVGAGMGTQAFGWKGGIGTSSRKLEARYGGYTVGVLVQTNYGGVLTMGGAPVGKILGRYSYRPTGQQAGGLATTDDRGDGSCMIVVATDAPIDSRDLKRLAARAVFGLARTGSSYSNGSGDFAIAFSTAADLRTRVGVSTAQARTLLPTDGVSPLFQAALEATEEAVYNSLLRATSVTSRFGTVEALPIDRIKEILGRYPRN